jgi:hypothetical protein
VKGVVKLRRTPAGILAPHVTLSPIHLLSFSPLSAKQVKPLNKSQGEKSQLVKEGLVVYSTLKEAIWLILD